MPVEPMIYETEPYRIEPVPTPEADPAEVPVDDPPPLSRRARRAQARGRAYDPGAFGSPSPTPPAARSPDRPSPRGRSGASRHRGSGKR